MFGMFVFDRTCVKLFLVGLLYTIDAYVITHICIENINVWSCFPGLVFQINFWLNFCLFWHFFHHRYFLRILVFKYLNKKMNKVNKICLVRFHQSRLLRLVPRSRHAPIVHYTLTPHQQIAEGIVFRYYSTNRKQSSPSASRYFRCMLYATTFFYSVNRILSAFPLDLYSHPLHYYTFLVLCVSLVVVSTLLITQ